MLHGAMDLARGQHNREASGSHRLDQSCTRAGAQALEDDVQDSPQHRDLPAQTSKRS